MKIIISPAKSLDFEKELPTKGFSIPDFLSESKVINDSLKKRSPSELKSLMSISDKLADLNWIEIIVLKFLLILIIQGQVFLLLMEMCIMD